MKNFIVIIFLIFLSSCFISSGRWVGDQCRPKRNNFKLLKIPFRETDKLSFKKVYTSDEYLKFDGIGFYPDGRMIHFIPNGNKAITENDMIGKNWNNTKFIGYWRVENNSIKIEYFVCGDNGFYIQKQGEIKGDKIIFYENSYIPFKKITIETSFVLSKLRFD
jgi:hypothetical protein